MRIFRGKTYWLPLAAAALMMLAAGPAGAKRILDVEDQAVADVVEAEIAADPAVSINNVYVRSDDGVVTLDGAVNNLLAKERAAAVARTVKGVRAVVNDIEVSSFWNLMDWEVEEDVKDALRYDPATEKWEIGVHMVDGELNLTGFVESMREKRLAGRVAKSVRGVENINNDITVEPEERTDPEIKEDVAAGLRWDKLVDDEMIEVEVDQGKVTLTGTVGSAAEKYRAQTEAYVVGVREVDASGLEVGFWGRDTNLRKTKYQIPSDQAVEDAIHDALGLNPRLKEFRVKASFEDGEATLRGEVDNLKAKDAAAEVARDVVGVREVDNRIKVRPSTPTDRQIRQNIAAAFLRDPYLERYEVSIDVVDGEAYLYGTVDSHFDRQRAYEAAATAYGVEEVHNNLDVQRAERPLVYQPRVDDFYPWDYDWYDYQPYTTYEPDSEIKDDITDQIWWSPFVEIDDVNVSVEEGTATLTGTVDSYGERAAAEENAYEGGAVWVVNNLDVRQ